MIKHLIFPKIQNVMDINMDLFQWFTNFLRKCLLFTIEEINSYSVFEDHELAEQLLKPIIRKKAVKYI